MSSRQGCNPAGGSPAASIARVGRALNIAIEVGYAPHTTKLAWGRSYASLAFFKPNGFIFFAAAEPTHQDPALPLSPARE
jgi:hypothetical protein